MIEPTSTEVDGLHRLLKWLEPKKCQDVTGEPCGCVLSDECAACIELEAAADFIRQTVEWSERVYGKPSDKK